MIDLGKLKHMKKETLEQLKQQHPDLVFESVDGNVIVKEKPVGRWRNNLDFYFYVGTTGNISRDIDSSHKIDIFRYETGNYFQTEKEAEAYKQHLIDRQKVLDKMRLNKLSTSDLTTQEIIILIS